MFDKVIAHTSFIGETGYSNHSRSFFTALNKLIPVKVRNFTVGKSWEGLCGGLPHDKEFYISKEHREMLFKQTCVDDGERNDFFIYNGNRDIEEGHNLNIVLNDVNHYYFYDKYRGPKIAYNVWESTLYPEGYFKKLLEFDQLWVPTTWQKKCVVEQGYPEAKVKVVPEVVDGDTFFPEYSSKWDGKFKFLLFGRWEYRKSTREIIGSFLSAFRDDEPVELILSADNIYAADGMKTTEERLRYYGLEDDRIKVKHFLSREDYVRYLKNSQVLVSCSRGEGWNLPLMEALACGTPSIYSHWGAQLEFAEDRGIPVDILGERPASDGVENVPGNYCEPNFSHLSEVFREVYSNYAMYKNWALSSSAGIRENFSLQNVSKKAFDIIEETKFEKHVYMNQKEVNDNFLVSFDSKSLGDSIAWIPSVDAFREKHECNIVVSTFWNSLFEKEYPEMKFVEPGTVVYNIKKQYNIGWYEPWDKNKNPYNFRTVPLQRTSSDILGLGHVERRAKITIPDESRNIEGKYVCIGIHSTAQAKYWNYPGGWQIVTDYLKSRGYKVVHISKEGKEYMGNKSPEGIIDRTGNYPIEDRIVDLKYADAFIGLGSGLSWLSWAIGTPVIFISGFSAPWCEFTWGVNRLHNDDGCHSCFNNPDIIFDKGDWSWCPENKNFECSKNITPKMVIKAINWTLRGNIEV